MGKLNINYRKFNKTAANFSVVVIMLIVFNLITNSVFLTQRNLTMLLKQSSVLMILASSLMMLLITRNFDLSGGAGVYLTGTIMALLIVNYRWNVWLAMMVGITLGLTMGWIIGLLVGYLRLPAFIVTLGAQLVFRGTGYVLTNAATIGPLPQSFTNLSDAYIPPTVALAVVIMLLLFFIISNVKNYKKLGKWYGGRDKLQKNILMGVLLAVLMMWIFVGYKGIPMAVVIAFGVAVIMHLVASKTVYGRHIYLIGGNIEAAKLAGIPASQRICQAYIVQGLMYGIAGIVLCARLGGAAATGGQLLELDAVAAACIGGTSMSGGIGTIMGVGVGVVIYTMIDNVMSLMNVSSHFQMVAKGAILLIAISIDMFANKAKFMFKLVKRTKYNV